MRGDEPRIFRLSPEYEINPEYSGRIEGADIMKLQFVKAGEIVTTHGIKGEVKVMCWLDDPEMLCEFDRCRIEGKQYKL